MKYLRLYADQDGESHVEEMLAEFDTQAYAPPAPAFGISAAQDTARYIFVSFPENWTSGLHASPRRQLFVVLSGHLVGETTDGTVMDLRPGDVVLMEDTTGKGHTARTMDGQGVHAMMVHLE